MKILKTLVFSITLSFFWSNLSLASTGCFNGETDGSQWIEQTINLNPSVIIDYNSSRWSDVKSFKFNFGDNEIENPRSFSITATLATPTTENQSVYGVLENENGASGGSVNANRTELYMNLNNDIYFNSLKTGKINLGLGRTGSHEKLEITKITASFCGVVIANGNSVTVDAATHNLRSADGEALVHYVDAETTYRAEISGLATDGKGNTIESITVNYIDPRKNKNVTQTLVDNNEYYIHSDGKLFLFYTNDSDRNTGGHTVKFSRVNLD
ncbi:hypothetical protein [Photobacterium kishitanii]|uniref:hypothetical protein n=1 Tax=Photobacterium kishitanii TaxID=318456 RepID=UPI000436DC8D|nr:hypothetical protein [Photobacterium kishitanii]PSV25666.1 hypothetical protein C0W28_00240 [Photobacterium kishitanii]CEO41938.1 conserved exported hypothetical protein [Photobacterium kishitanii]